MPKFLWTGCIALALAQLWAAPALARAGYVKKIRISDLVGTWRQTKRGPNDRVWAPAYSYLIFKKRGRRVFLKQSAGAALWSTSKDGWTRAKSLHTAVSGAWCTVKNGVLTANLRISCAKLHHQDRRRCTRIRKRQRLPIQIWRNDIFGFDLLIVNGKRALAHQKWYYRMPVRPRSKKAEARLIGLWSASLPRFGLYNLRLYHQAGKGYRFRLFQDGYQGRLKVVYAYVGSYRVRGRQLHMAQTHAFVCPGVTQWRKFEGVSPPDLARCRGGKRAARSTLPYTTNARRTKHSTLRLLMGGRRVTLTGVPD